MMNPNSGLSLNNYKLGWLDIGLCLTTGLTCAPYAKRHWTLSNENSRYSLWHKGIAVLEYTPVIGGLVAVVERVIVFTGSFFSTQPRPDTRSGIGSGSRDPANVGVQRQHTSPLSSTATPTLLATHTMGNATALEFITCINPTLFTELTKLTQQEAQEFLSRGGALNVITEGKIKENQIVLRKEEQVITGCNSGINRSQVAAAVVIKRGIPLKGVLAGGDSAMNPEADFPSFANPSEMGEEQFGSATNFEKTFGIRKLDQVGFKELKPFLDVAKEVITAKKFYQDYIDQLSQTHFITFGPSGPSVLRRLLKRNGSLNGFTITHCPWGDEIAHPPEDSQLKKCSTESYARFALKLSQCFRSL